MPEISRRIRLRDGLGAELAVIGSGPFIEILSGPGELLAGIRNGAFVELLRHPDQALAATEFQELTTGLDFDRNHDLAELSGGAKLEYFVKAGAQASLGLKRAGARIEDLTVPAGEAYSVLGLSAHLDSGLAVPIVLPHGITVTPGVRGGAALEIRSFKRHRETDSVRRVLESAVGGFRFPFHPESVAQLGDGDFITYRFDGRLAFSTKVSWGITGTILVDRLLDLSRLSQSLKSVELFGEKSSLGLHVPAEVAVQFVHGLADELEFRVKKLAGSRVSLEIRKAQEKQNETSFEFTAGLAVDVSGAVQDQLRAFLSKQLAAGPAEAIGRLSERLVSATEDALAARARIDLATSYRRVDRGEKLFHFEFDLARAEARLAYARAAEGDLTLALAAAQSGDSVTLLSTIETVLNRAELKVRFNLLGIFSFTSVEELAKKSIVEVDLSGDVSLYHESSFKAKSETSLGHLEVADFLFKAAWNRAQAGGSARKDFDFTLRYTFSEKDQFTSRQEIVDVLNLAVAFGVLTEARKQEILSVPFEFRRALTWPILGLLSPESTYGRSSILIESTFSESGLASLLEHDEDEVWATYIQAFRVAQPRSTGTDWMDPGVRDLIDRDGWAAFVNVADPARRAHRQLVVREYDKAKQFVLTLRVFREAVRSGQKDEALIELMSRAGKAARNFHFDKAAFTALHLLSSVDGRRTRFVIEGDKVNAVFPNGTA